MALLDRPAERSYVSGMLWLDVTEKRAQANLRSALWRLGEPDCRIIEVTGERLSLKTDVHVDVKDLCRWARAFERQEVGLDDVHLDELLLSSELLPDWYDDWVLLERERYRQVRLHALEASVRWLVEAGRFGRAIESALAAVATEPLRESAQRSLIGAYIAEGNASEAIRQYRRYCELLQKELGLEPSPLMTRLLAPIMVCR